MNKLLDLLKRCTAAVAAIACIGLGSGQAMAAIATSGCADPGQCSLAELASGSSFSAGSQSYGNWSFGGAFGLSSGNELGLSLGSIFVTPFEGLAGLAGFNIFGSGVGEPADEDWALSFGFSVNASSPLLSAGLELPGSDESGLSFVMSDLSGDGYVNAAIGIPAFAFDELAVPVPELDGLDVFSTFFIALGELLDVNQIFVSVAQTDGGGGAAVPEPASLLLALAGLGVIGAMRARPQRTA